MLKVLWKKVGYTVDTYVKENAYESLRNAKIYQFCQEIWQWKIKFCDPKVSKMSRAYLKSQSFQNIVMNDQKHIFDLNK